MNLHFVTSNESKAVELQKRFRGESVHVMRVDLGDLLEIQGKAEDVATAKCKAAFAELNKDAALRGAAPKAVLVEDTALCFDAWNGLPGPYIKDFFANLKCAGLVNALACATNKSAVAQCTFALQVSADEAPRLFIGRCNGTIVAPRVCVNSDCAAQEPFAWDPIFEPTDQWLDKHGKRKTFAQMTIDEKNAVSHRQRAIDLLVANVLL